MDMLSSELMLSAKISYGTIVNEIKEVSRSYKEAKMALEVGKIFFVDKEIIAYNALGIGRLIYQCRFLFVRCLLRKSLRTFSPDDFDEETLSTLTSSSRTI